MALGPIVVNGCVPPLVYRRRGPRARRRPRGRSRRRRRPRRARLDVLAQAAAFCAGRRAAKPSSAHGSPIAIRSLMRAALLLHRRRRTTRGRDTGRRAQTGIDRGRRGRRTMTSISTSSTIATSRSAAARAVSARRRRRRRRDRGARRARHGGRHHRSGQAPREHAGLETLSNSATRSRGNGGTRTRRGTDGRLHALMLDTETTFDQPGPDVRGRARTGRTASSRTASTATSPARCRAPRSTWRWRSSTSSTTPATSTSSSSTPHRRGMRSTSSTRRVV